MSMGEPLTDHPPALIDQAMLRDRYWLQMRWRKLTQSNLAEVDSAPASSRPVQEERPAPSDDMLASVKHDSSDELSASIKQDSANVRPSRSTLAGENVLAMWRERLEASIALRRQRQEAVPNFRPQLDLPIARYWDEIVSMLQREQVLVVAGETGSGKSTQLPLACLAAGFGVQAMIGHTQPRRIAARAVAARVAQQLQAPLGRLVGYKMRFHDETHPETLIKVMTDGTLLAEIQSDRWLTQYEVLIIDEAHERSLNIDFLLGYLKQLLPKRPELRLIITSATIDADRFAAHFSISSQHRVPVISVEGRSYGVEIRYRPPDSDSNSDSADTEQSIATAIEELSRERRGDILVFLPTEQDIRAVSHHLRGKSAFGSLRDRPDVLPLYARLPAGQQQLVFQPHDRWRVVLATNVAESSLTVPGIRYVIDTGTARLARYSPRGKVQRLPIEPISQASADQRAGRCGRLAPGVCIRLYSEEDYLQRARYPVPEIRRTNLASAILQIKALRLGDIHTFPFLDPPRPDAITDGYRTLFEIGAIDERRNLTLLGKRLARMPADPRIARMIYEADRQGCLAEILIVASVLEIQDPRIRPADATEAADRAHGRHADQRSDFVTLLKLWDYFHKLRNEHTRSKLRRICAQNFLSYTVLIQWMEIHRQLRAMATDAGLQIGPRRDDYDAIHRSLLAGLLSGVAMRKDKHRYAGPESTTLYLWPGSGLFTQPPTWIMAAELVETKRRYARIAARIRAAWLEPLADHIVQRRCSQPRWSAATGAAVADERVTLYGLPIVARRQIQYARVSREVARDMFINEGLIDGRLPKLPPFVEHNQRLKASAEERAARLRRREQAIDEQLLFRFYDDRLPEKVFDWASLTRFLKQGSRLSGAKRSAGAKSPSAEEQASSTSANDRRSTILENPLAESLYAREEQLVVEPVQDAPPDQFPDKLNVGGLNLPLSYRFALGQPDDGITVQVPREALARLNEQQLAWLVPGRLTEKIAALIKTLPKPIRRLLVPAPQTAKRIAEQLPFGERPFYQVIANLLSREAEQPVRPDDLQPNEIDAHLQFNIALIDEKGELLDQGRNLKALQQRWVDSHDTVFVDDVDQWSREGVRQWEFDELPDRVTLGRGGIAVPAFPAIVDRLRSVDLRLMTSEEAASRLNKGGITRLLRLRMADLVDAHMRYWPDLDRQALLISPYVSHRDLMQQLGDLLVRVALVENLPTIYSRDEFERRVKMASERVATASQILVPWFAKFSTATHESELAMQRAGPRIEHAQRDARMQTRALLHTGFLRATEWAWLQHYPRYFSAISVRFERLSHTPPDRDHEATQWIEHYWHAYVEQSAQDERLGNFNPELDLLRWMLEEYRVSVFAQTLGTSLRVSPQRLHRQAEKAGLTISI